MDDMNMGAAQDDTAMTGSGDMAAGETCAMCNHKMHGMEKCAECDCMGGEKHEDMPAGDTGMGGADMGGGSGDAGDMGTPAA